jgi:CDP-diacylglycerol--serine O-phosphatidyltransferase
MTFKKYLPNLLTLGNLFCGTVATIFAVEGDFILVALFVVIGIFFDFLDGFVARILNVTGELGKQLDSLADMVTSGLVPGIVMFNLLANNQNILELNSISSFFPYFGFILTLGACYRLAKFNIDSRQLNSFIGLPTPAMSLFVISLPLIQQSSKIEFIQNLITNNYILCVVALLLTYLMISELPLFSLKFKEYSVKNNAIKYFFLAVSLLLIVFLQYVSIPLIVLLYVVLSMIITYQKRGNPII